MIKDLVRQNRSCRRFHQEVTIELETLRELVDLARFAANGRNKQPLKYMLFNDIERNALIFAHIDIGGNPQEGDRPPAYIIILGDKMITEDFVHNHAIAAQNIMLGATEKGLGSLIIGGIQRDKLREALVVPPHYEILLLVAIGKSKETTVIDTLEPDGDSAGWWDNDSVRHTPKRKLDDIIIN